MEKNTIAMGKVVPGFRKWHQRQQNFSLKDSRYSWALFVVSRIPCKITDQNSAVHPLHDTVGWGDCFAQRFPPSLCVYGEIEGMTVRQTKKKSLSRIKALYFYKIVLLEFPRKPQGQPVVPSSIQSVSLKLEDCCHLPCLQLSGTPEGSCFPSSRTGSKVLNRDARWRSARLAEHQTACSQPTS